VAIHRLHQGTMLPCETINRQALVCSLFHKGSN
jgi:hypothetical protein